MRGSLYTAVAWGLLAAVLMACGGCGRRDTEGPPTIHIGEDVCAECGMIISDERFACAIVDTTTDGRVVRLYDDIGEMRKDPGIDMGTGHQTIWVRDFVTSSWLDARHAVFLVSPALSTPMGSGVAAFADRADAKSTMREFAGEIVSFEKLPR